MPTDIEIARAAKLEPIPKIAGTIGIPEEAFHPYGRWIAKIDPGFLAQGTAAKSQPKSKLILVTAITPTAAGEGKTTTTVGLVDGLRRDIGKRASPACASLRSGPVSA